MTKQIHKTLEKLNEMIDQPLNKNDYKAIKEMDNIDVYNHYIKSYKRTKAGFLRLIRSRMAERNISLKDIKDRYLSTLSNLDIKGLFGLFADGYLGTFKPSDIQKVTYYRDGDVRKKISLNASNVAQVYADLEKGDITKQEADALIGLSNTKAYTPVEQKEYQNKLTVHQKIRGNTGVSLKTKKIIQIDLSPHQVRFMNHFIYNQVPGAIMFHGVGTGKTLTAVATANFYLMVFPFNKVYIASPPALLDNFASSLVQFGLDVRDNRYIFTTHDKLIRMNPKDAKNSLVIIDEAHNFRTKLTVTEGGKDEPSIVSSGARVHKILNNWTEPAHKILLLTGTAFVNELYDIENLITMIDHRTVPHEKDDFYKMIIDTNVRNDYFRYKVSHYFNPTENEFFPTYTDQLVPILPTEESAKKHQKMKSELSEKFGTSFYLADRLASNKFTMKGMNPKIRRVIEIVVDQDEQKRKDNPSIPIDEIIYDKSIVYSGFINDGVNQLKNAFEALGIKCAVITGQQNTGEKIDARVTYNSYSNKSIDPKKRNAELPRILIISKAGAEGVDTVWTTNLFLLDGCWNEATNEQIIARAIRFKSHWFPGQKSRPNVNVYRMLYIKQGEGEKSEKELVAKLNKALLVRSQYSLGYDFKKNIEKINEDKDNVKVIRKINENAKTQQQYQKLLEAVGDEEATSAKFKSDKDLLQIAQNIRAKYAKNKRKDMKETIKKEIAEAKQAYWKEKGKRYAVQNNLAEIQMNLASGFPSIELYLYLLANAKQQVILQFIKDLDTQIQQLEQFDIDNTQTKIIDTIVDMNYHVKRRLEDGEIWGIINALRNNALEKTTNSLLALNYTDAENKQFNKVMTRLSEKMTKKKEKQIESRLQEYFTPADLVINMIEESDLLTYANKSINLLEPTAGEGGIVAPVLKVCMEKNINIAKYDLVEYSPTNRATLDKHFKSMSYVNISSTADFFDYTTDTRYDIIFMNPPFNLRYEKYGIRHNRIDLDFVFRAHQFLAPGGQIVALVYGEHVNPDKKKYATHNDLLKKMGARVKRIDREWNSTQKEGETKVKIKKLPLALVIINASGDKKYTPVAPIDIPKGAGNELKPPTLPTPKAVYEDTDDDEDGVEISYHESRRARQLWQRR
jgi:hypothetical protein